MTGSVPASLKPLLRGHFHQAAFFMALGACLMLVVYTKHPPEFFTALIYSISLVNMFGVSALYHRPQWSAKKRAFMRRLDHSSIFILIAGTATPVLMLTLDPEIGAMLAAGIWLTALVGVAQAVFWTKAPKVISIGLYIFCGWYAAPYIKTIGANVGAGNVALLVAGGIVYTVGALVYALKKPDPFPKVFGYHEVFHFLVVIGAVLHFIVVSRIVN